MEKGTELTIAPTQAVSPELLKVQVQTLNEMYKGLLQNGTDYGTIAGTNKPSLYKAGAELLALWAGLSVEFVEVEHVLNESLVSYTFRCIVKKKVTVTEDVVSDIDLLPVAEGWGNCNSREEKYYRRWQFESELPKDVDKATLKRKEWNVKNQKYPNGRHFVQYALLNDNPLDLANTILKMAKKRAYVDGIINATGASRIFTQDVEDMPSESFENEKPAAQPQPKAKAPSQATVPPKEKPADSKPADSKQGIFNNIGEVLTKCQQHEIDRKMVVALMGGEDLAKLNPDEVWDKVCEVYLGIKPDESL